MLNEEEKNTPKHTLLEVWHNYNNNWIHIAHITDYKDIYMYTNGELSCTIPYFDYMNKNKNLM